ncbi:MAG: hypothetical protein JO066_08015 [Verrucomicrobia bacterium]|nr:hypothetical protein [Verrucomicrobiota bacterium]
MRGDRLVLNISKVEEKGRALGAPEIAVVVPLMEQTLSTFNNIQGDRSVHEARVEDENLVLGR